MIRKGFWKIWMQRASAMQLKVLYKQDDALLLWLRVLSSDFSTTNCVILYTTFLFPLTDWLLTQVKIESSFVTFLQRAQTIWLYSHKGGQWAHQKMTYHHNQKKMFFQVLTFVNSDKTDLKWYLNLERISL